MKLPEGVRIIECDQIEFAGKDLITINNERDFIFLLAGNLVIFKIKNTHYIISDSVAYMYQEGDRENGRRS